MSKKSSFHEWTNTAGVVCAILVSFISLWFTWQSQRTKDEKILIRSVANETCRLEHQRLGSVEFVGLCWNVSVSNASENKTSIISVDPEGVIIGDQARRASWVGLHELELPDGKTASLPITIDGGETKEFLVRTPLKTPNSVTLLVSSFRPAAQAKLQDLNDYIAKRGLDLIGNNITAEFDKGKRVDTAWSAEALNATVSLVVKTGRGETFKARMRWPIPWDSP